MEYVELCQQLINALDHLKSNSADNLFLTAYLFLVFFKRDAIPVILLIAGSSLTYFYTLQLPESQFYILSSIACSYVTMYYYRNKSRVCIGLALMTFYMFLMGQEAIINVISEQFYNSLYDSYELCISAIHIFIIALFIKWKRVFNSLAQFFHDARSGSNGVNYLFNVL